MIRYILLVVLNAPLILMILVNALVQFKMKKISGRRFLGRSIFCIVALFAVVAAFPIYNNAIGMAPFALYDLSLLDIVLTTAIIYLIFFVNYLRLNLEKTDDNLKKLHRELSIRLSKDEDKIKK